VHATSKAHVVGYSISTGLKKETWRNPIDPLCRGYFYMEFFFVIIYFVLFLCVLDAVARRGL
jgi:hypothetical protein